MLGRLPKGVYSAHCAVGDMRDEERYYRKQLKDFNDAFTTRNAKKRGSIPLKLLSDQYKDDFSELGFMRQKCQHQPQSARHEFQSIWTLLVTAPFLWAYERFLPLAPAPNSGEGILRGERYGDAKGPQKSTGWYFKIINSEENFEWRRHIARIFSPYLRMVTPSHIFGVPQKDMGRGTFGKTSIDEKKASITVYKPHRSLHIYVPGSDRVGKNDVLYERYLINALKDFTETEVEEIARYLDFKDKAMMGRAKEKDKNAQGNKSDEE
ncbi:hypothetical protein Sjap_026602 [Stephania japonica]|uniref:Uncharacterized protein n=1 Tax=Stephania japonica TaxID=461633 RepID=A0AAP0DXT2_9MAGN